MELSLTCDWSLRCCFFHHCCLTQISSMGCKSDRKLNALISCDNRKPRCRWTRLLTTEKFR